MVTYVFYKNLVFLLEIIKNLSRITNKILWNQILKPIWTPDCVNWIDLFVHCRYHEVLGKCQSIYQVVCCFVAIRFHECCWIEVIVNYYEATFYYISTIIRNTWGRYLMISYRNCLFFLHIKNEESFYISFLHNFKYL